MRRKRTVDGGSGPGGLLAAILPGALAVAAGTAAFGWWAVPVVGLAVGWFGAALSHPLLAGAASGFLGWAALLTLAAVRAPVGELAGMMGGILGVPGAGFLALTLVFPGLLAGTAASLGSSLRRTTAG